MPATSLPARASVEYLRKQSKHLHRAFRDGDAEARARIREHLPRAGKLSVDALASMELSLQEAQHALACEYGFSKWEELLAAAEQPGFDDLARLTDQEAQRLLRDVDQRDFVRGLIGAPRPVLERFLGNMSTRVRGFITTEMAFHQDAPAGEVEAARSSMMARAMKLAEQGQLVWPPNGYPPDDDPDRSAEAQARPPADGRMAHIDRPLAECSDDELVGVVQAIAEQARREGILSLEKLAGDPGASLLKQGILLVVDGTEPNLVTDMLEERAATILRNRRIRGRLCIEAWMSIQAGDNPRIVRTKVEMHFQEEYSEISAEPREASAADLVARLADTPLSLMSWPEVAEFFHDLAWLARRENISACEPVAAAVADLPELQRGIERALAGRRPDDVLQEMQATLDAALRDLAGKQALVITGLTQTQLGRKPVEIAEKARAAAAAARGGGGEEAG